MRDVWWLSPKAICLLWTSLLVVAYLIPEAAFDEFANAPKYIDFMYLLSMLGYFAVFWFGASLGANSVRLRRRNRREIEEGLAFVMMDRSTQRVLIVSGALAVISYVIWFAPMMTGGAMSAILSGASAGTVGRDIGNQVSGVTTLTQLGIANVIIAAYGLFVCRSHLTETMQRVCMLSIIALISLATFRSLAWAERLALIEVVVPVVLIWLLSNRRITRRMLAVLPVIGLMGGVVVFGVFEYFRSWGFYQDIYSNYLYFSIVRFLSYYFTSFNNGVLLVRDVDPSWLPINTLTFLFKFPFLPSDTLNDLFAYYRGDVYVSALRFYGNPEYNTFSAPALLAQDFGLVLGGLVFGVFGFFSGKLYRLFLSGSLAGLLIYPFWFVGFLDLGRILYWTTGRAFPAFVMLFFCIYLWRQSYSPRRIARRAPRRELTRVKAT